MRVIAARLALAAFSGSILSAAVAHAGEDVVIVYDASGSMWGQIEGTSKMEIARDVLGDLVQDWDAGTNLGLVAYGHRSEGDCTDIETLVAPGPLDMASFRARVDAIRPVGKTPISAAIQHAADLLAYRDNPATVVLISDGVETCNADPCALSAQLAQQGVKFTAHVVGFDLNDEAQAGLACIAENTGGVFLPASNAAELHAALDQVQAAMVETPSEPTPEPEPALPAVTISGPEIVTIGAAFDVSWSPPINVRDMVTILPMGTDEGVSGPYQRVGDETTGGLVAPPEPGLYELRYILNDGAKTLATAPIEVVDAEVIIAGPETVTTGAAFDLTWSPPIHVRDMVTILPVGTDDGVSGPYQRVGDETTGGLVAPSEPGLYELRYILNNGAKTLATAPIEVVEAVTTISGPETVTTGAAFDLTWSPPIHVRDMVTILPVGTDEGVSGPYQRVGDQTEGSLVAPAEPGLYELRYILNNGLRTLATASIEVVEAETTISGPEMVTTGAAFDVTWSPPIHERDMVTILPVGTDEGVSGPYQRVGDETTGRLVAPAEPGLYELRYILNNGAKTLAAAPIEVTQAEIGISGPAKARAGTDIEVSWSSTIHARDMISIVLMGARDGEYGTYFRIGDRTVGRLKAPTEPGLYELRYILNEGGKTLASTPLEVLAEDAPMDAGAGLTVPQSATRGEVITVSWTGGTVGSDQRISLARKDQPDFAWITAQRIGEAKSMQLTMPDQPGLYEVRFLDISAQQLLGRSVVEVR